MRWGFGGLAFKFEVLDLGYVGAVFTAVGRGVLCDGVWTEDCARGL